MNKVRPRKGEMGIVWRVPLPRIQESNGHLKASSQKVGRHDFCWKMLTLKMCDARPLFCPVQSVGEKSFRGDCEMM